MDFKKCYCCDKSAQNLLTATCGHRTCFHCNKNNKHKCKKCNQRRAIHSLSPLKSKSNQKTNHMQSQETRHSPFMETQRMQQTSSVKNNGKEKQFDFLMCPDHQEPLNMFCKHSKQILCSVCLCKKSKYGSQILPLRSAQDFLRKQNKKYREEARFIQSDVENAWRIINKNRQVFEQSLESHTMMINSFYDNLIINLREMQQNSVKLCRDYLESKINEYGQISQDLTYLNETLKQFRQTSKDTNSVNELAYMFNSYKVIKKTLQTLSFDYIAYQRQKLMLIELDKHLSQKVQKELIKFRFNLQVKKQQKTKPRSSTKSPKKPTSPDNLVTKHKLSEQSTAGKKHKLSLCSNGSFQNDNFQNPNLYKRLLQAKFKV